VNPCEGEHAFGAWTSEEKDLGGGVTKFVLQRRCFLCPMIEEQE